MEQLDHFYSDEEDLHHPVWLDGPKGFIDFRSKEAETFNDILYSHIPDQVIRWDCTEDFGWIFELEDLVLDVENIGVDPIHVRVTTLTMPRAYVDPLRQRLRRIVSGPIETRHDMLGFATILLRLVEEAVIFIQAWEKADLRKKQKTKMEPRGWDPLQINQVSAIQNLYWNDRGADLDTVDTSGEALLGRSIKKICEQIPEGFRILHVEYVLRQDLASRFLKRQGEMIEEVREMSYQRLRECVDPSLIPHRSSLDNKKDLAREICKTRVSFHGTKLHDVRSIVRWGFVKPGEKAGENTVGMAYGSSFGVGVYSSPEPEFSLMYSQKRNWGYGRIAPDQLPGIRLIVCAVLMGRALQVRRSGTRRTTEIADRTAHSHVSQNSYEWVVFNPAQIIPCYVIHLDLGVEWARVALRDTPENPNDWKKRKDPRENPRIKNQDLWPAEAEEVKQAKRAVAAKWFPFGYGTAKGTSFVIEEIGEVDEDEEIYGEYQAERQEVDDEFKIWNGFNEHGRSWFDEYQTVRNTYEKD